MQTNQLIYLFAQLFEDYHRSVTLHTKQGTPSRSLTVLYSFCRVCLPESSYKMQHASYRLLLT